MLTVTTNVSHTRRLFFTIPRAAVTGKLKVDGTEVNIDGYGFCSHFAQNIRAHHVALRWQLMKFHSENFTINQNLLVTPKQVEDKKNTIDFSVCLFIPHASTIAQQG